MTNNEIVTKLWNLCNVLRDDGITYHQYVTELTYILFLKMAKETGTLWEHDKPEASCNHGFASHIIYWLAGIYGTCEQEEGGTK